MAKLKDTNVNGDLSVDGEIHIQKDIMSGGGSTKPFFRVEGI